ncbi:MAG: hypothetical protein AAFY65_11835 [Pseudomonadota bacterium]
MRILIVGATGDVGLAASAALAHHRDLIPVGLTQGTLRADFTDRDSRAEMYQASRLGGAIHGVVCCAGEVHFGPRLTMFEAEMRKGLNSKVLGQINLFR